MASNIYILAQECKEHNESEIKIEKIIVPYKNYVLTDYTVSGEIKEYLKKLLLLRDSILDKYPTISLSLQKHIDKYDKDPIIHLSAIETITDCIIALEAPNAGGHKIFISYASEDEAIVRSFINEFLIVSCGLSPNDIFCTINHSDIRTGEEFRNAIIKNMKLSDFIICLISDSYQKSEVCANELGAAWAMEGKRVLPFKFPNISFNQLGFLNIVKQVADITDIEKLTELYQELASFYNLQQNWVNFNRTTKDFIDFVNHHL